MSCDVRDVVRCELYIRGESYVRGAAADIV